MQSVEPGAREGREMAVWIVRPAQLFVVSGHREIGEENKDGEGRGEGLTQEEEPCRRVLRRGDGVFLRRRPGSIRRVNQKVLEDGLVYQWENASMHGELRGRLTSIYSANAPASCTPLCLALKQYRW